MYRDVLNEVNLLIHLRGMSGGLSGKIFWGREHLYNHAALCAVIMIWTSLVNTHTQTDIYFCDYSVKC